MKDKTVIVVLISILLICIVALFCICIAAFIYFPFTSAEQTLTTPFPSTPISSVPDLFIKVSPDRLMLGTEAQIQIRMNNAAGLDLKDYTLLVGYRAANNITTIHIAKIPLTSETGDVFEETITWHVEIIPDYQDYEASLTLLKPDSAIVTSTSVPIAFVEPTLLVSIDPTQLTLNTAAKIHIQVANPSGADLNNYKLLIGYAAKDNTTSMYPIREIPLSLAAGESFEQDIAWAQRTIPPTGECEVRVQLLLPDGEVFIEAKAPFTLTEK